MQKNRLNYLLIEYLYCSTFASRMEQARLSDRLAGCRIRKIKRFSLV